MNSLPAWAKYAMAAMSFLLAMSLGVSGTLLVNDRATIKEIMEKQNIAIEGRSEEHTSELQSR